MVVRSKDGRIQIGVLEDGVLGTLEDSGKIPAAARQGSGIAADYRLVMDIRHFQAEYAGAALPSVVIEVSAKLLHAQDQAVVGSRSFRHAQPAGGTDVALVADAFSQALGATSRFAMRSRVDLPEPLSPSSTHSRPVGTSSVTRSTTARPS